HSLPNGGQSTFQIPKEYIRSISSGIRAGDRVVLYASGGAAASGRLFDEEVVVASVKSAANTEIVDTGPASLSRTPGNRESMASSRRDANAPIDHINLNLTEEQWLAIDRVCGTDGGKLVIAFAGTFAEPVYKE